MRAAILRMAILCLMAAAVIRSSTTPPPLPSCPIVYNTGEMCLKVRLLLLYSDGNRGNQSIYIPQCDERGNFEQRQCRPSTGECWCVNPFSNEEVNHTRTTADQDPPQCGQKVNDTSCIYSSDLHHNRVLRSTGLGSPTCCTICYFYYGNNQCFEYFC